jgi:HAD superfamily hydrolase (TIGR01509 family)
MERRAEISVIIFDCDGVMFDSRQANINFYNHLLVRFDLPPMKEEQVAFVHMHTAEESVRLIFDGTPYVEEAQKYRMTLDYTPFIADMKMEPGLQELLNRLKSRFGLAVATSRSNTITPILQRHDLQGYFRIVVSALDVIHPKPHPESVFKILAFFGVGPDQAVYIGDSIVDYETAQAAGVTFVSYRNKDLNTAFRAESMADIAAILNRITAIGALSLDRL